MSEPLAGVLPAEGPQGDRIEVEPVLDAGEDLAIPHLLEGLLVVDLQEVGVANLEASPAARQPLVGLGQERRQGRRPVGADLLSDQGLDHLRRGLDAEEPEPTTEGEVDVSDRPIGSVHRPDDRQAVR